MIAKSVLAPLLTFTNWAATTATAPSARIDRADGVVLQIRTSNPGDHLTKLLSPHLRGCFPLLCCT